MTEYAIALGIVFAVNLLPAFGPPTWSILVFFYLTFGLEPLVLVPAGAVAAATGRFVLASTTRRTRSRMSPERLDDLASVERALTRNRARTRGGLALFAVSPVPSAQLFVGAGLLTVPLLPLTVAFFCGRVVSYSLYVGAASAASESLGTIVRDSLTSPLGIALQLLMLAALALLLGVDWSRRLGGGSDEGPPPPPVRGGYVEESRITADDSAHAHA
jgi:membrane protein YqaA with SNARE-associated domain